MKILGDVMEWSICESTKLVSAISSWAPTYVNWLSMNSYSMDEECDQVKEYETYGSWMTLVHLILRVIESYTITWSMDKTLTMSYLRA